MDLKSLFQGKPERIPNTHDYSKRYWGHDYTFTPIDKGMKADMIGWGKGILAGDYMILEGNTDGSTTRYRVDDISYFSDPNNMFYIKASFALRDKL